MPVLVVPEQADGEAAAAKLRAWLERKGWRKSVTSGKETYYVRDEVPEPPASCVERCKRCGAQGLQAMCPSCGNVQDV